MIFTIRFAHPFTFEGNLNPDEFAEWPRVSQGMIPPVIGRIIVQNPDASSPIQKIQLLIFVPADTLITYQYFRNGEIFRYELDIKADRYVRKHLTGEEKIGCMKCHEDKIIGGQKHGI